MKSVLLPVPFHKFDTNNCQALTLATTLPDSIRQKGPEESNSVIHAPESFRSWVR